MKHAFAVLAFAGALFSTGVAFAQSTPAHPWEEIAMRESPSDPYVFRLAPHDKPGASVEVMADGALHLTNMTPEEAAKIAATQSPLISLPVDWNTRLTCVYEFSARVQKSGAEWDACVGYGNVVETSSGMSTSPEAHRFFLAMADEYRRQRDAIEDPS